MAIDPMLYEKMSGRKGDPYTRLGAALAKNVKAKAQRDEMPKGVRGGLRTTMWPGILANLFFWLKDKSREK